MSGGGISRSLGHALLRSLIKPVDVIHSRALSTGQMQQKLDKKLLGWPNGDKELCDTREASGFAKHAVAPKQGAESSQFPDTKESQDTP